MKHLEIFYSEPGNISQTQVVIKGDEHKHLSRVLRKQIRDVVEVVDGKGNLYTVVLTEITKQNSIGEIQKRARFVGEPNFKLTLAQAIPKGSRFEFVIEKGTELGVTTFIPLLCQHSIIEDSSSKKSRWEKIAIAAMKQCGRSVLPEITPAQTIHDVIRKSGLLKLGLIAHPQPGAKNISTVIQEIRKRPVPVKSAVVLIGPEGGFSTEEVNFAIDNGYNCFSLGQRRLRSETAGITSTAIIMELMEELV